MTALPARLFRLDAADDVAAVARWLGTQPIDPTLRGYAAILPALDEATRTLFSETARVNRLTIVQGASGDAIIGDLAALRWLGREMAASLHAPTANAGRQIAAWTEAITGNPAPMQVRKTVFDWNRPIVMGIVNVTPDS